MRKRMIFAIFILLVEVAVANADVVVKKSTSEICHTESSPYYFRLRNYTSYPSLEECMDSGGRLLNAAKLEPVTEHPDGTKSGGRRGFLGK
ncbi:MAG: hypothetical protein RBR43_06815 [Desulfuromonadaceae bacterium]|nr:hypothetical protein [Desulfuromonadaceae bacterium]